MRIKFDKTDGFLRIYNGTRFTMICDLTLFRSENYDVICNRIRYLLSLKSSITHIFSHYFANITVDSYDSLPIAKRLTFHFIILIKSVLNKDKYHYYYKIFLEECLYQLAKNNHNNFFHSIIILRFGEKKVRVLCCNIDNIVISKCTETKTNSKYLIGY